MSWQCHFLDGDVCKLSKKNGQAIRKLFAPLNTNFLSPTFCMKFEDNDLPKLGTRGSSATVRAAENVRANGPEEINGACSLPSPSPGLVYIA